MEIASIRAFVAVAELGSFSEAARFLHLTQPAVSKRVALLEEELEEKLFDRVGRKTLLTEAGRLFLPRCQTILQNVDDAILSLDNLSGHVQGKLAIGTSHHIGLHHLPSYLREFSQRYPTVNLDIQFMTSEEVQTCIAHGDLELGIVTLPDQLPGNVTGRVLWRDALAFMVNKTHPLAQCRNIQLAELSQYAALLPEKNTYTREIVEQEFAREKLSLKTKLQSNYLETLKMMVSVGLGWSVLPVRMLDDDLQILHVGDISIQRNLGYIQNKNRTLSNAAVAMIGLLHETMQA